MKNEENKYLCRTTGGIILCVQVLEESPRKYGVVKFSSGNWLPIGRWGRRKFDSAEEAQADLEKDLGKGIKRYAYYFG